MFDKNQITDIAKGIQTKKGEGFSDTDILCRVRLCLLLDQEMSAIENLFGDAWSAWESHSDYRPPDKTQDGWFWLQVVLMGVWCHTPGRYGHNKSYVVGTIPSILTHLEWAKRM